MRHCSKCGTPITACNGFTKAGDLLELWDGARAYKDVRELCGTCILPATFFETDQQIKNFLIHIGWGPSPAPS